MTAFRYISFLFFTLSIPEVRFIISRELKRSSSSSQRQHSNLLSSYERRPWPHTEKADQKQCKRSFLSMASISADVISAISTDISQSLKTPHRLKYPVYLSYSEGGGGSTGVLECELTNKEFFAKVGGMQAYDMLRAEFLGVTDIYNTQSIRVPQPICFGSHDSVSYLIFEKLSLGGYGSDIDKARKLVAMHRNLSPNSMFGYHINNTIGATFQPNTYTADWAEFWDIYRLGHMLTLAKREGAVFQYEEEVRKKTKEILRKHDCQPSLVHGDLWSGNQGFLTSGEPVIYDPATYVRAIFSKVDVDCSMSLYCIFVFHKNT